MELKENFKKTNEQITQVKKEESILKFIYDKEIECPICGRKTKIKTVKKASLRIKSRDSDFDIHYYDINPMLYEIIYCVECGYASLPAYFNDIKDKQKALIFQKISSKWQKRTYEDVHSIDTGIQLFKLALLNAVVKESKSSEMAFICLKISWLYRELGDSKSEKEFQMKAITEFESAYKNENLPIGGLDEWNLLYLIGELYRRIGQDEDALRYFSQVLISTGADYKLKEKVRDQRDLIKSESN